VFVAAVEAEESLFPRFAAAGDGERYVDECVFSAMMTRATMEAGINVCRCIGG